MAGIIKKIQKELLSNLNMEVVFEPTLGQLINVEEIFKVKILITNNGIIRVHIHEIEILDNAIAKVVGEGLLKPHQTLDENESYISPEIEMMALSALPFVRGGNHILVNYNLNFDQNSIFAFETLKQERVPVKEAMSQDF